MRFALRPTFAEAPTVTGWQAVKALAEKWLPTAKASAKPSADDRRLIGALEWWLSAQEKADDDLGF